MEIIATELTLPPLQSIIIWRTSWITIVSITYGVYYKKHDLIFISGGVLLNSLNYWRHPIKKSWRRYIDISFTLCSLAYILFQVYKKQNTLCGYLTLLGVQCYINSNLISKTKYNISVYGMWISTYMHCLIHIIGNINNILLYK